MELLVKPENWRRKYIYEYVWTKFFTGDFVSLTVHFVNICMKNKYTNYSFSLLIMYGSSYMFRHYIAIFRERS
jgi:hypothetical protein